MKKKIKKLMWPEFSFFLKIPVIKNAVAVNRKIFSNFNLLPFFHVFPGTSINLKTGFSILF